LFIARILIDRDIDKEAGFTLLTDAMGNSSAL